MLSYHLQLERLFLCNVLLQTNSTDITDYLLHHFKLLHKIRIYVRIQCKRTYHQTFAIFTLTHLLP